MLANGADPNAGKDNWKALDSAGSIGSAEALKILLPITKKTEHEEDVYDCDEGEHKKVKTPWYYEILFKSLESSQCLDIWKLLKAEGVDFNLKSVSGGDTLLHSVMGSFPSLASLRSSIRSIKRDRPDLSSREANSYYSEKSKAVEQRYNDHLLKFMFLLNADADPSVALQDNGNTAVHQFVEHVDVEDMAGGGYARIIDKCIGKGFKINTANADGFTLLHIAAWQNDIELARYLISRGADINAKDKLGRTPLHLAAVGKPNDFFWHSHPAMTAFLVNEAHADIHVVTKSGLTALEYSKKMSEEEVSKGSHKLWGQEAKDQWQLQFQKTAAILLHGGYKDEMALYLNHFEEQKNIVIHLQNLS